MSHLILNHFFNVGLFSFTVRYFAEKPHMATSPRDEELANYIRDQWESQIDEAYLTPYEIMHGFLSEDANKPNRVTVVDPTTYEISFELRKSEIVYPEYMKDPETIVPYYSAFGPPGDVQVIFKSLQRLTS